MKKYYLLLIIYLFSIGYAQDNGPSNDGDASQTNETISSATLSTNNTLTLTEAGSNKSVDLSPLREVSSGATLPGTSDENYLFFNTTDQKLYIYNSGAWKSVITVNQTANEGVVKINTGAGIKPTIVITNGSPNPVNVPVKITYSSPLGLSASPTTSWPENITSPSDSDIYDFTNNTFIENTIPGQVQTWRVIVDFSNKAQGALTGVILTLRNTLSGFVLAQTVNIPNERTSGTLTFYLVTIADGASLPPPFGTGQGYIFDIESDDPITFVINSITRISHKKD